MDSRNIHALLQKHFSESNVKHEKENPSKIQLRQSARAVSVEHKKEEKKITAVENESIIRETTFGWAVTIGLWSKGVRGPWALGAGLLTGGILYFLSRAGKIQTLNKTADHLTSNVEIAERISFKKIKSENMMSGTVDDAKSIDSFYLGFAKKIGFAEWYERTPFTYVHKESPLAHSSIALVSADEMEKMNLMSVEERNNYVKDKEMFLIMGRQSPSFRRADTSDVGSRAKIFESEEAQIRKASLLNQTIGTQIDNEKNYDLFDGAPFEVEMTSAKFTKEEINSIIQQANENICKAETCTMIGSNCYSASVYMLGEAIKVLHNRKESEQYTKEMADADIANVYLLMIKVAQHNKGEGTLSNNIVIAKINECLEICKQRGLIVENNKMEDREKNVANYKF